MDLGQFKYRLWQMPKLPQLSLSWIQSAKRDKCMDNSTTGLVTSTKARSKTGSAVSLAELLQKNLLSTTGQFSGPVNKEVTSPLKCCP